MYHNAYKVKIGDLTDIECSRTSCRRRIAAHILESQGAEYVINHSERCRELKDSGYVGPGGTCDSRCVAEWSEWVTDRMFDLAWSLADEIQTHQARWNWKN